MEISDKEIRDIILRHLSVSDGLDPQSIRVYRVHREGKFYGFITRVAFDLAHEQKQPKPSPRDFKLGSLIHELGVFGRISIRGSPTPSSMHFTFEIYSPQELPRWDNTKEGIDYLVIKNSFVRNESTTWSSVQVEPLTVRATSADGTYVDYYFNFPKTHFGFIERPRETK